MVAGATEQFHRGRPGLGDGIGICTPHDASPGDDKPPAGDSGLRARAIVAGASERQHPAPGRASCRILLGLLETLGAAGNLTTDAHLAALAIEHQVELHSTDADFVRFPGLRWTNPIG